MHPNRQYTIQTHYRIRKAVHLLILALAIFSFLRLSWLYTYWHSYNYHKSEQFIIYTTFFCLAIIALSTFWTLEQRVEELLYLCTQRCVVVPLPATLKWPIPLKSLIAEVFVYGFGCGALAFPLFLGGIPFVLDYEPIQLTLCNNFVLEILPMSSQHLIFYRYFVKFIGSFVYMFVAVYSAGILVVFFLLCIAFGEGLQIFSGQFYVQPMKLALVTRETNKFLVFSRARCENVKFSTCHKRFQQGRILVFTANLVASELFFTITFVGVVLAGCAGYCTLKMYNDLPLLAFLTCPVMFFMCVLVTFILTYLADKPNRNSIAFKRFWSHFVKWKRERKELSACPEYGYSLGPFRNAKAAMGLVVTNVIIQCTVNILLVDSSNE